MPTTAEQYFQREVIKTQRAAKQALKEITDLSKAPVIKAMSKVNDMAFKSRAPILHSHFKKSFNGGGRLKHVETSKAAAAILASSEMRKFAKRNGNSCVKASIKFRSQFDLAGAFYDTTFIGEVKQEGKKFFVKGQIIDTFDFRWDLWPKDVSLKGFVFRVSGNAAFIAQEMGLIKPVKITVNLAGPVK